MRRGRNRYICIKDIVTQRWCQARFRQGSNSDSKRHSPNTWNSPLKLKGLATIWGTPGGGQAMTKPKLKESYFGLGHSMGHFGGQRIGPLPDNWSSKTSIQGSTKGTIMTSIDSWADQTPQYNSATGFLCESVWI